MCLIYAAGNPDRLSSIIMKKGFGLNMWNMRCILASEPVGVVLMGSTHEEDQTDIMMMK